MSGYAESREQCVRRQRLVEDGAPQKGANRQAYIPAHNRHGNGIIDVGRRCVVEWSWVGRAEVGSKHHLNFTSLAFCKRTAKYGECAST
jgi:hypothetical protein